jgi:integrase
MPRYPTGIRPRHRAGCASTSGCRCNCRPAWEASIGSGRTAKVRRTFASQAAAKSWRADALTKLNRGELTAAQSRKIREAATELIDGMRAGTIRTRSGDEYKPSAIRSYDEALRVHVLPAIGALRLSEARHKHVQAIVDRLHKEGKSASTIRNAIIPLRVIYRRAIRNGEVTVNPCSNLDLPAVRGRRERIPSPQEAAALLAALPEPDRALWATALYAGLRRGELLALQWDDIDLAKGVIRVRRAMDARGSIISPKSAAGIRAVPVAKVLRAYLAAHRLRNSSAHYVFGSGDRPFVPTAVSKQAEKAWTAADLAPIGLHDARHAAASVLIAAGVNVKALATYMGHASITITLDRYGHLFSGNEAEAAALVDAYLDRIAARRDPFV